MLAHGITNVLLEIQRTQASDGLVVVLLEQLVAKLNVLVLGVLLAQASVNSLLPLVVLGLALQDVSTRICYVCKMHGSARGRRSVIQWWSRAQRGRLQVYKDAGNVQQG